MSRPAPGFVPAVVVPEERKASLTGAAGRTAIVLTNGRQVIVDAGVDPAALARVLDVLERR